MKKQSFEDAIPTPQNFYFKLWKAKQAIGKVAKNSKNPHFKSSYADINAIIAEVEPVLLEYHLLLLQPIENGFVKTYIIDAETGENVCSEMKLTITSMNGKTHDMDLPTKENVYYFIELYKKSLKKNQRVKITCDVLSIDGYLQGTLPIR